MNDWKLKREWLDDFEAHSMSNPIHPDAKCSFELPVKLKVAIADAVTIFSRIETCVLEIVWLVHGADVNQKRKLAKRRASDNFLEFKAFMSLPDVETDAIWKAVERVSDERHLIAHGVWMIVDDTRPFVVWHKFLENNETVVGEYFDYNKFEYFMKLAQQLLETFTKLKPHLEEIRNKLDQQENTAAEA